MNLYDLDGIDHIPGTAREVQQLFDKKEAQRKRAGAEKKAQQALEEKRHKESLALTQENVKLMDENNKMARQSLRKSIIANWIACFSAFIAVCSLGVAIYALLTK